MEKKTSYYKDLVADYSKPGLVPDQLGQKLVSDDEKYMAMREATLPQITSEYNLEQIEKENKEWWPARCEAMRRGRGDLLGAEATENFVYICQDGPFYGKNAADKVGANWWAILRQPGVTMIWPIVVFHGEVVYFEWACVDDATNEMIAKGNVTYLRRGHRGGCYVKTEQLTFFRNVSASPELMQLINS